MVSPPDMSWYYRHHARGIPLFPQRNHHQNNIEIHRTWKKSTEPERNPRSLKLKEASQSVKNKFTDVIIIHIFWPDCWKNFGFSHPKNLCSNKSVTTFFHTATPSGIKRDISSLLVTSCSPNHDRRKCMSWALHCLFTALPLDWVYRNLKSLAFCGTTDPSCTLSQKTAGWKYAFESAYYEDLSQKYFPEGSEKWNFGRTWDHTYKTSIDNAWLMTNSCHFYHIIYTHIIHIYIHTYIISFISTSSALKSYMLHNILQKGPCQNLQIWPLKMPNSTPKKTH